MLVYLFHTVPFCELQQRIQDTCYLVDYYLTQRSTERPACLQFWTL